MAKRFWWKLNTWQTGCLFICWLLGSLHSISSIIIGKNHDNARTLCMATVLTYWTMPSLEKYCFLCWWVVLGKMRGAEWTASAKISVPPGPKRGMILTEPSVPPDWAFFKSEPARKVVRPARMMNRPYSEYLENGSFCFLPIIHSWLNAILVSGKRTVCAIESTVALPCCK